MGLLNILANAAGYAYGAQIAVDAVREFDGSIRDMYDEYVYGTYNAVDVRSSAQPSRNDNWWVTMLFAVAAASPVAPGPLIPGATTEPRTAVAKNSR